MTPPRIAALAPPPEPNIARTGWPPPYDDEWDMAYLDDPFATLTAPVLYVDGHETFFPGPIA